MNTEKQAKFIEQYCLHGNATKAAQEAGYSEHSAKQTGYALKEKFKREIDERNQTALRDKIPMALSQLGKLLEADSEATRLAAVKDILDRAGMKPVDRTEVTTIESMSDEEIQRRIDALTKH